MKLLACTSCFDMFALTLKERTCACGKTSGQYIDEMRVSIVGPGKVLGIHNSAFLRAIALPGSMDFNIFTIANSSKCIEKN